MRNIRQNLFLAFVYNGLGIPIAAGVLYPFTGTQLSPMFAAAAMALSSLSVVANASRLRRWQPRPVDSTPTTTPAEPTIEIGAGHQPAPEPVLDPVCGMAVEPARDAAHAEHRGVTYHFCSTACHDTFAADPDRYTAGTATPTRR